jgi:hypothetical protein
MWTYTSTVCCGLCSCEQGKDVIYRGFIEPRWKTKKPFYVEAVRHITSRRVTANYSSATEEYALSCTPQE